MTDNETRPQCRAQLSYEGLEYRCERPENHEGGHVDRDNDTWDITYVDEPSAPAGLGSVEISDLSRRVTALEAGRGSDDLARLHARLTALEAAWTVGGETLSERIDRMFMALRMDTSRLHTRLNELDARLNPVCGHRDPSSGRVCQRAPDHYGEVHRDMITVHDSTAWTTGHSSQEHRECHGEQCVKPTVLATQVDGRQLMSDGSVRDPAESGPAC